MVPKPPLALLISPVTAAPKFASGAASTLHRVGLAWAAVLAASSRLMAPSRLKHS
jgi:hypothetical protein